MKSHCVKRGQTEIGIVEHEGREFVALGASVNGRDITAYINREGREITLQSWFGHAILACRSEIVETYRLDGDKTHALVFSLTHGRYVVGYALADNGMLFRGELIDHCDFQEAAYQAKECSRRFMELDAEDQAQSDDENSLED
jgi:hypothetical protein